jgi:hypothetical protein
MLLLSNSAARHFSLALSGSALSVGFSGEGQGPQRQRLARRESAVNRPRCSERLVGPGNDPASSVSGRDDLEGYVGGFGLEGNLACFVRLPGTRSCRGS